MNPHPPLLPFRGVRFSFFLFCFVIRHGRDIRDEMYGVSDWEEASLTVTRQGEVILESLGSRKKKSRGPSF